MSILLLLTAPIALANSAPDLGLGRPMDEASLGAIVGMAGPTSRLSVFVREQGTSQVQLTGEDLRASMSIWFTDDNIQSIANMTLRSG